MDPSESKQVIESPWSRPASEVLDELSVDAESGLDEAAVVTQRQRYGANALRIVERTEFFRRCFLAKETQLRRADDVAAISEAFATA